MGFFVKAHRKVGVDFGFLLPWVAVEGGGRQVAVEGGGRRVAVEEAGWMRVAVEEGAGASLCLSTRKQSRTPG